MVANEKFLYKDLSYKIIGCFYEIYNEIGPAHKEQIYHEALKIALNEREIKYKSKPKINIRFKGQDIGMYEPDFIVEE